MANRSSRDDGFSVVELIIAMFLLAILALALLPLFVGATRASAINRTSVAADTFAAAQLAPIRHDYPNDALTSSCSALRTAYARTGIPGPSGSGLAATVAISTCPAAAALPGTVTVTVTVYHSATPSQPIVTLPSRVLVASP